MGVAGQQRHPGIHISAPAQMQQTDPFVAALPMRALALLGAEFLIIDRVVVLVEPQHDTALIGRVVRDKEAGAIPDENALGIKETVSLKHLLDRAVEPLQPGGSRHVP